ncbi:MAG: alanyl-tRNA editing protein [Bryobacteraceae bacterium]
MTKLDVTQRLYYTDSYLTEFRARVVDASPDQQRIYLDRTAFYPTSGGQPFDTGHLGGLAVIDVIDEGDRIAHLLSEPLMLSERLNENENENEVEGRIDLSRRFDHMQQHTGQHLLSAVLLELFDAPTVSFHLGGESSTIDIARTLEPLELREAERRANQIVFENRPVTVGFQHSSENLGLRKPTEREGDVRIISIQGLDRSACGGTHVRATGEIGPILLRKLDRIRGNPRIEFLCGGRAVARARADFEALSQIARVFSATLDDAPAMVEAQREKLQEADKVRRRLANELAAARGRALYAETPASTDGIRRVLRRVESSKEATLSEELRAEAQSFASAEAELAIFLALAENPPSVLLACSKDSGVNAGDLLKRALAEAGGRGGGNAALAQGSLPSKEALDQMASGLARQLGLEYATP